MEPKFCRTEWTAVPTNLSKLPRLNVHTCSLNSLSKMTFLPSTLNYFGLLLKFTLRYVLWNLSRMKSVIACASQEASAKYIFTVKPLPNLHKEDLKTKYRVITCLSVESTTLQVKLSTKNHRGKRIGGCGGRVGGVVMCMAEQRSLTCS